ncbi:MAG: GH1 family beta-glucosidase [Rubrivivax sp.]
MNSLAETRAISRSIDPAMIFPADFVWGVATSAAQIEGAAFEDGRGESIWDRFCRQPGAIADGSHIDVACDHYHRLDEDLDLIASLGVNAYRFSVAWPRVQPQGRGAWNPQGLDFYRRLVDGLRARGLQAHVTLNHWDLPQALQEQGGWAARETVDCFVDYARGIARHLGDGLTALTTHNEPWVMSMLGHDSGIFAPGIKDRATAMQVSHHLLLSHGRALRALRDDGFDKPMGIVLNLAPLLPATPSAADVEKTRLEDGLLLRWYLDPLFGRGYPQDVLNHLGAQAPRIEPGDLDTIAQPLGFLGINYYSRSVVSAAGSYDVRASVLPLTDMDWEIYPQGLTELLLRLHRDYPLPPTYVTENGGAFPDRLVNGQVHDADRIQYLNEHIGAVGVALRQGVPMAGYMVWSLLDNFEWASGYAKRFGIVHVDYETQRRTLKDSALWLRELLRQQAEVHAQARGASKPAAER